MIDIVENGDLKWYHINNPSDSDLAFLKEKFNFHDLDLEDCLSNTQRPKIDIYDDYYFIILHFPYFEQTDPFLKIREVKLFWGKDYIITVRNSHWIVLEMFKRAKKDPELRKDLMSASSDILLYNILERLLNQSFNILGKIGSEIEIINTGLFSRKAFRAIEKISVTRRNIINLDTIFKPQLRLFRMIESGKIKGYAEDMEEYWGNVLDFYNKIWDMTEDYKEIIEGLSKTFDSLQANRTNEIMKVLTLISSILLPLTLIASIYGMNIALPFEKNPFAFWIVASGMIAIVTGFIFFFKRKNWM